MALLAKNGLMFRTVCLNNRLTLARPVAPLVNNLQIATLKLTHGEKYPYWNPWDYKNRRYNALHDAYDRSLKRLNENSKLIVVEGNIGAGKNHFAKKLAEQFDLHFIRSPTDHDCFTLENPLGADIRILDGCMPEDCKIYDLKKFLTDPNPQQGRAGFLQKEFLRTKYHFYFVALLHLLSTGQGVVVVRTPYGDPVFSQALANVGFVSQAWKKFYDELYNNTICDLMTPHLTIYLDVSVENAMNRINARKCKEEEGHRNLERLVGEMDDLYREGSWLKKMGETGQVMEVDWNEVGDDLDVEVVAHEISQLRFECHGVDDPLFQDWGKWNLSDNEIGTRRMTYQSFQYADQYFNIMDPGTDCPETYFNMDQNNERYKVMMRHPAFAYHPRGAEELGYNTKWKLFV